MSVATVVTSPWRGLLVGWAERSHCRALVNARTAAVVCSRARLERAEVDAWLRERRAADASRVEPVTSAR
jgi:hypothetical protein